jgi:uncharacterized protein
MDLSLERPEGYLYVRRVAAHGITLIDRELTSSFLLAPDRAIENWPVTAPETLDASHVETLLALKPELVVLGTGAEPIHLIGHVVVLFRRNTDEPKIALPR